MNHQPSAMTVWTLVARSLRFHWRAHLGVLLGATLSTAILVGALTVGDSVRYSLRAMALARLGNVHLALNGQSRFFREELADELTSELKMPVVPIILLRGMAVAEGGDIRAGRVQVVGVDERFWKMGGAKLLLKGGEEAIVVNERLAQKLSVKPGEEVLLRVDKPSLLSRDAPLSTVEDASVALRLQVAAIATDAEFGRFSLEANQIPPFTAFVPLKLLQQKIAMPSRVNVLLVGKVGRGDSAAPVGKVGRGDSAAPVGKVGRSAAPVGKVGRSAAPTGTDATATALAKRWRLADAGLELRELRGRGVLELRTDRVFLDPPVAKAAMEAVPGAQGVLTYFVNEIRLGNRSTPYSTVSALEIGKLGNSAMQDDEIIINEWLARDLQAKVGDKLRLTYYVVGPMRRLKEQSSVFRVRAIVPIKEAAADPDLMPDFPGLADAENCRDWEAGIPIDLEKIRDKDEQYWDNYRGTPKAFVTLRAGQRMWNNRFGNLTAVRYPMGKLPPAAIEACIKQRLNPASIGLFFVPVREHALAASEQAMDFGMLFLGFSIFLIVAALLLTALLFAFGVEQRREEIGTLLALGFRPRRVQGLLVMEGGSLALIASVVGAGAGVLYTKAVIHGLSTVWRGAVANAALQFHAEPATLILGAMAGFVAALLAIYLVTRKQARAPARELLAPGFQISDFGFRISAQSQISRLPGLRTALISILGALGLVGTALTGKHEQAAGIFFGAGALLLIGGIAACRLFLARLERSSAVQHLTVASLGVRNNVRRVGRSLATIGLLACGSFMVIAIGANRHDPHEGSHRRSSGTGGFALYGETTLPVYHDLNSEEGRDEFGLDAESLQGVRIVQLRLREGDEASCLNLNRVQTPRLLGVNPDLLSQRFSFTKTLRKSDDPWELLGRPEEGGAVPAIGDTNTVVWSLGKKLGDTLSYVDERGSEFRLRIVGILANSILQGSLLISEDNFTKRFPSQGGYQVFLIDTHPKQVKEAEDTLTRALEDVGLDLTSAPKRLAEFNTVENTYLSIFTILGGLGLLLGSIGLGVVVLRNVLERRSELALLRAVGFSSQALKWLVFSEHALLLTLGLVVGLVSALVAVLPAVRSPGAEVPYVSLTLTLCGVFLSGFLWTWGATALALRGPLLAALRNE